MKQFKHFMVVIISLQLLIIFFLYKITTLHEITSQNRKICGRLPQQEHITIDNVIWQVLEIPNGFYKLMNAYLDERENRKIVRVSAIGNRLNKTKDEIFCQFWFDENPETQPFVVRATQFIMIWPESEFSVIRKDFNFNFESSFSQFSNGMQKTQFCHT